MQHHLAIGYACVSKTANGANCMVFCDKVKWSLEGKNVKFTGYNLNEFLTQEF